MEHFQSFNFKGKQISVSSVDPLYTGSSCFPRIGVPLPPLCERHGAMVHTHLCGWIHFPRIFLVVCFNFLAQTYF